MHRGRSSLAADSNPGATGCCFCRRRSDDEAGDPCVDVVRACPGAGRTPLGRGRWVGNRRHRVDANSPTLHCNNIREGGEPRVADRCQCTQSRRARVERERGRAGGVCGRNSTSRCGVRRRRRHATGNARSVLGAVERGWSSGRERRDRRVRIVAARLDESPWWDASTLSGAARRAVGNAQRL